MRGGQKIGIKGFAGCGPMPHMMRAVPACLADLAVAMAQALDRGFGQRRSAMPVAGVSLVGVRVARMRSSCQQMMLMMSVYLRHRGMGETSPAIVSDMPRRCLMRRRYLMRCRRPMGCRCLMCRRCFVVGRFVVDLG